MRISNLIKTGALAAAAALALAGCKNSGAELDDVYAPIAASDRFPIELRKGAVAMEIPGNRRMSPANQDKLLRLAQMAHSNRASTLIISRPAGSTSGYAVAEQAQAILIRGGIPADAIVMDSAGGGTVVVSYTRTYAVTTACGDWAEDLATTGENRAYENFGCASQQNLAAMVANPEDLAIPETSTPSDPTRRSQVFIDYRTPKSPATPIDEKQQVTVADVAK
jgi:pilus assembly protein CpaD